MAIYQDLDGVLMFKSLPAELVLEIFCYSCAATATNYRSLLLVSKGVHELAKSSCLPVVPVVLLDYRELLSFKLFLRSSPRLGQYVHYLWIFGEGLSYWILIDAIVASCTSVISLSCTSRTLASICAPGKFLHTKCTELTLIETWHGWDKTMEQPHASQLCSQLTHLRLSEGLTPEFPKQHFQRLTHIAFSSHVNLDYAERHLEALKPLPVLQYIVLTSLWYREGGQDASAPQVLGLDRRLAVLHCRKNWTELNAWKDRVKGGFNLWDQAKLERKSMMVFHGAFKALARP